GPGEIYIIDLGSTKGTLVNGQKVNKAKVQSGDEIVLGATKIIITVGEPVATAADDGPTQVQLPAQPAAPPARAAPQMGIAPEIHAPVPAPSAFPPPPVAAPQLAPPQAPTMQAPAPGFPPP